MSNEAIDKFLLNLF